MSGVRDLRIMASPPSRFLIAAVAIVVRGHSALTAMPLGRSSPASPSTTMLMPKFGHRVACIWREPFFHHVERRGEHQDVRVLRPLQMSDCIFGDHEGAARVDLMHQIE